MSMSSKSSHCQFSKMLMKLLLVLCFFIFGHMNAQILFKLDYINNSPSILMKQKVTELMVSPDSTGNDCPFDRMTFDTFGRLRTYAAGSSDETEVINYSENGNIASILYNLYGLYENEMVIAKDTFYYKNGKLKKVLRFEYDSGKLIQSQLRDLFNYEYRSAFINLKKDSVVRSFDGAEFSRPCHNPIKGQLKFVYQYLPNGLIEKILILNENKEVLKTLHFLYNHRT